MTSPSAMAPASDRLLARAVRLALRPDWDLDRAVAELAALDPGPFEVQRAWVRSVRALDHRSSEVARRVADAIAAIRETARQPVPA